MADLVGEVAVRVVADARSLDKDIEKKAERAGENASKSFMQTWNRDQRKQQYFKVLRDRAEKDAAAAAEGINKQLRAGVKPIDIKPRFDSAQSLRDMDAWLADVEKKFHKNSENIAADMTAEIHRAFESVKKEQITLIDKEDKDRARSLAAAIKGVSKAQADAAKSAEGWVSTLNDARVHTDRVETSLKRIHAIQGRIVAAGERKLVDLPSLRAAGREATRLRRTFDRVFDPKRGSDWLRNLRVGLSDMGHGTWSRLLFKSLGAVVGGAELASKALITLITAPFKIIEFGAQRISSAFDLLAQRLQSSAKQVTQMLGTVAEGLGQAFGAISSAAGPIGQVAAAIAAVVVPLMALVTAGGVVVSALSMITGAITLVGSAALNAAAGLAVLGPALASLGLGAAAVFVGLQGVPAAIGAFGKLRDAEAAFAKEKGAAKTAEEKAAAQEKYNKALDEYNKALGNVTPNARAFAESFDKLRTPLSRVQKLVQQALFDGLADDLDKSTDAVQILGAAFGTVAVSVNKVIRYMFSALRDPKVLTSLTTLITSLGVAFEPLGRAAVNFGLVFVNVLNALTPILNLFAADLETLSQKMLTLSQDPDKMAKITTFFTNAYEAAKTVLSILGELGNAMFTFLSIAQPEGQSFLDTLLQKAKDLNAWLDKPENKEKLQGWLRDARNFGDRLWQILGSIAQALADLDTPQNRKYLDWFMQTVAWLIEHIPTILSVLKTAFGTLAAILEPGIKALGLVVSAIEFITGKHKAEIEVVYKVPKLPMPSLSVVRGVPQSSSRSAAPSASISPQGARSAQVVVPIGAGGGRTITNNITVNSPMANPSSVATQVVNRLAVAVGG